MPRWARRGLRVLFAASLLGAAAAPAVPDRCAYVVSSHDRSLSRVDLASGEVVLGLGTVGAIPNRIEVASDLNCAVIVNSGSDDITLYDLHSESVLGNVTLPAGSNPWTCEIYGTRAFVSCLLTDKLYEIDLVGAVVTDSAETGVAPEGMCLTREKLYVANTGFDFDDFTYGPGTVSVFTVADLAEVATVPVGLNPQECLLAPAGDVHVICSGDYALTAGSIHVIDPATDTPLDSLAISGYSGGAAIDFSGVAYVNVTTFSFTAQVWAYDTETLLLLRDGANPLLPTTDFYGNLRVDSGGLLFAPAFAGDLLLREDPAAPGTPDAWLVGDGPVDLAVVEREPPVGTPVSGLRVDGGAASRAYPNPFRTSTTIEFQLPPTASTAHLEILDVGGRRVLATDLAGARSGRSRFHWDGRDAEKRSLAPGVYFVRLKIGPETYVQRVLRLR